VAQAIGVSRTSLYNYDLADDIRAAAKRQQKYANLSPAAARRSRWRDLVRQIRVELGIAEERNKSLCHSRPRLREGKLRRESIFALEGIDALRGHDSFKETLEKPFVKEFPILTGDYWEFMLFCIRFEMTASSLPRS
jgi:hypothetical protein